MIAMPRRTASTVVVALLVTLLLAIGCGQAPPKESGDSGEMEIRAYKVPEGLDGEQLRNSLAGSLGMGSEERLGTAYTYGDGSVVVTAPASVHAGVEVNIPVPTVEVVVPGVVVEEHHHHGVIYTKHRKYHRRGKGHWR